MIGTVFSGIHLVLMGGWLVIHGLASPHLRLPTLAYSDPVVSQVKAAKPKAKSGGTRRTAKSSAFSYAGRPDQPNQANPVVGVVGEVNPKGKLKVLRGTAKLLTLAELGTFVRRGDSFRLEAPTMPSEPPTTAGIKCNDGTIHRLKIGMQPCPCKGSPISGTFDGIVDQPPRGHNIHDDIPIVISPRKTSLINPRPSIRWRPVAGANQTTIYKVFLYGEGRKLIWSRSVAGKMELSYPDDARPLDPGDYSVNVETGGHQSREEPQKDLGFTVLGRNETHAIQLASARIRKLARGDDSVHVLQAILYANRDLYADAIAELSALPATARNPAILRLLGSLYVTVARPDEAEKLYTELEKLYDAALKNPSGASGLAEDLEGQALTKQVLARLTGAKTKAEEAIRIYDKLGDSAAIEAIRQWLAKLADLSQ
jgi:hypothetical protein